VSLRGRRPARLDVLVITGGLQLVVPAGWKLRIDVEPDMAGIRDARTGSVDGEREPDLVLSGRIVMGGLDISTELPGERRRLREQSPRSAAAPRL
jgi:hypothetical protein